MVVDDRVAIIGSANINERSQRGDRDSELACIIRDTDMVDSTMAGKPYKVGRFAHTLRVRLMREHLGVDVDALEEEEANMDLLNREPQQNADDIEPWDPKDEQESGDTGITREKKHRTRVREQLHKAGVIIGESARGTAEVASLAGQHAVPNVREDVASLLGSAKHASKHSTITETGKATPGDRIVTGQVDGQGYASTVVPTLEEKVIAEGRPEGGGHGAKNPKKKDALDGIQEESTHDPEGRDRIDEGKPMDDLSKTTGQPTRMTSKEAHDTRQFTKGHQNDQNYDDPQDIENAHSSSIDEEWDGTDHADEPNAEGEDKDRFDAKPQSRHVRIGSDSTGASASATPATSPSVKSGTKSSGKAQRSSEQTANSNKANDIIRKSLAGKMNAYSLPTKAPKIDAKKFGDPLIDSFYKDMWMSCEPLFMKLNNNSNKI